MDVSIVSFPSRTKTKLTVICSKWVRLDKKVTDGAAINNDWKFYWFNIAVPSTCGEYGKCVCFICFEYSHAHDKKRLKENSANNCLKCLKQKYNKYLWCSHIRNHQSWVADIASSFYWLQAGVNQSLCDGAVVEVDWWECATALCHTSSCASNILARRSLHAKGQGISQAGVMANYPTVPENWVLIQRKIGYPASPSKTNSESGMSYCSVMIELMPLESVIINQIWWEWINSQLLDVIQPYWLFVCEGRCMKY